MEKGNETAAGEGVSEVGDAASSSSPGSGAAPQPAPTDGQSDEAQAAGGQAGGSQADQSGPTRQRDPWAGVPDVGQTTLPDGTELRRDADGNMHRGPDEDGKEHTWNAEGGYWPEHETWGDPASDWLEAWTGEPLPEEWKGVPREGSTRAPGGFLGRDAAGGYTFGSDTGGRVRWNEQTGQWYDAQTGQPAPDGGPPNPTESWIQGAAADAQRAANAP